MGYTYRTWPILLKRLSGLMFERLDIWLPKPRPPPPPPQLRLPKAEGLAFLPLSAC